MKSVLRSLFLNSLFLIFFCGSGIASENGPEEMILKSKENNKKEPVVFSHKSHQKMYECGICHHGQNGDENLEYKEGSTISACVSCHNEEKLKGKKWGLYRLDTIKGAAHGICLECHKKIAEENQNQKKLVT